MAKQYLDKAGLGYFWGKIKSKFLSLSGGTLTNADKVFFTANAGDVVRGNPVSIIQSPIPKYLWHDVLAFCKAATPKYFTTTDGTTWTEETLEKRLFAHKEAWGEQVVLSSSKTGSRWVWLNGGFYASGVTWLVFGITYKYQVSRWDVALETSSDGGSTWTTLASAQNIYFNQTPIWVKVAGTCQDSIRLTITNNSNSVSGASLGLCAIRLLTVRWGNQGKGSEFEYPYTWDGDGNMAIKGTINGHTVAKDVPSNAIFTDTTYSNATTSAAGLMSSSDKTKLDGIEGYITNAEIDAIAT